MGRRAWNALESAKHSKMAGSSQGRIIGMRSSIMKRNWLVVLTFGGLLAVGLLLRGPVAAAAQQAGTPTPEGGPRVEAFLDEPTNVRAGPGTDYDLVGTLVKGQSGAILGQVLRSPYVWLKIVYIGGPDNAGWVLKDLVRVAGDLNTVPILDLPPTPTLPPTSTAAGEAFEGTPTPGPQRLPTFTAPPPVVRPTLLPVQGVREGGG
ncbi:MAG: SH3b protein, partial [Anaerolineales bacterium]|nr:SH3b protein [Anaerolineales bacterium]